jgi:prepilin-type processing-associated H-X9-DG protein
MAISSDPPRIHEQQLPASPPRPVMSYAISGATRRPSNPTAVWSVIFGLLFFSPLAIPGILSIFLGRRGLKAAEERVAGRAGWAQLGVVLGVINLVLSLLFAISSPFVIIRARQQTQTAACAANLRSIAAATIMYSTTNKDLLPTTIDQLAEFTNGNLVWTCPACGTNQAKPPVLVGRNVRSHYFFVLPTVGKMRHVKQPARTVVVYEPPSHHDNRGMNVAFCDGHVEFITGPTALKIAAELAAGQNPPPSKR